MHTHTIVSQGDFPSQEVAKTAAEYLQNGEVVALPTETVYGLAADALNPQACARIFEAKNRPLADPLIVHVPDASWVSKLGESSPLADTLVKAFWPGPLTLVLPRSPMVPDIVTGGQETVALRMSAHPVFQSIIQALGKPVAAPSANRFGRISPTTAAHVYQELTGRIPLIVDGGPCCHGIESTIVQIHGTKMHVLRSGPISAEALGTFGEVVAPDSATPVTPGSMKSHYAPTTQMELISPSDLNAMPPADRACCGLLLPAPNRDLSIDGFARVEVLSESGDLYEMATHLYAAMRRLDEAGLKRIWALPVKSKGIGMAIMERLCKASASE